MKYMPLRAYTKEEGADRFVTCWQKVLIQVGRTRGRERERVPKMPLNEAQKGLWRELMEEVKKASPEEFEAKKEGEKADEQTRITSETEKKASEEEKASEKEEEDSEDEKEEREVFGQKLSAAQRACLKFYISLLDQKIRTKEYGMAFVCALTGLGVDRRQAG